MECAEQAKLRLCGVLSLVAQSGRQMHTSASLAGTFHCVLQSVDSGIFSLQATINIWADNVSCNAPHVPITQQCLFGGTPNSGVVPYELILHHDTD